MASEVFYTTSDTLRLVGTFRDWAETGSTGALLDPDEIYVSIVEFDGGAEVLAETAAYRESKGVYYYDWITPETPNRFIVKYKGIVYSVEATPQPYPVVIRSTITTVDVNINC